MVKEQCNILKTKKTKTKPAKTIIEECACEPTEIEVEARKITLWDVIDKDMSEQIVDSLLHFMIQDIKAPVEIWINSNGGDLAQAFAIYDVMQMMPYPIYTIGLGIVASCAVLILAAGSEGYRTVMPNTRFVLHQVSYEGAGTLSEMNELHEEAKYMNKRIRKLLAKHSTVTSKQYKELWGSNVDIRLSSTDIIDLGLADHIIE